MPHPSTGFERQLKGYRLATIEVTYHMPDHPDLLQIFVWQALDLPPHFPKISKFLKFWEANLDGKLHEVRLTSADVISPGRYHAIDGSFLLH